MDTQKKNPVYMRCTRVADSDQPKNALFWNLEGHVTFLVNYSKELLFMDTRGVHGPVAPRVRGKY